MAEDDYDEQARKALRATLGEAGEPASDHPESDIKVFPDPPEDPRVEKAFYGIAFGFLLTCLCDLFELASGPLRYGLIALGCVTLGISCVAHIFLVAATGRPKNSPEVFLTQLKENGPRFHPVLVMLGDSITHGAMSGNIPDKVASLLGQTQVSTKVSHGKDNKKEGKEEKKSPEGMLDGLYAVVNAGWNGNTVLNMIRRLEAVMACKPRILVIMAGTNDVKGIYNPGWGENTAQSQGLSSPPSWDGFESNMTELVSQALKLNEHQHQKLDIALCTLPPLGEDLDCKANDYVRKANGIITAIAKQSDIKVLPVFKALALKISTDGKNLTPGSVDSFRDHMNTMAMKHYILNKSWDALGAEVGNVCMTDCLHLNDTGAAIVAELVAAYAQSVARLKVTSSVPVFKVEAPATLDTDTNSVKIGQIRLPKDRNE